MPDFGTAVVAAAVLFAVVVGVAAVTVFYRLRAKKLSAKVTQTEQAQDADLCPSVWTSENRPTC